MAGDGIKFDFSELTKLSADLGEVPRKSRANIRKAVEVTSRNVKDSWKKKLQGSKTLPALPGAISYDVLSDNSPNSPVTGEIGFDKDRNQGPLGNISEFGSPTVAPRGFGLAALQENIEDFQTGLGIALGDPLE